MFKKIYKNSIIEKPKFTLLILAIVLLTFGYFTKAPNERDGLMPSINKKVLQLLEND